MMVAYPRPHHAGLGPHGRLALLLRVDADKRQIVPELFEQKVKVHVHRRAAHNRVWQMRQPVNLLDGDLSGKSAEK